MLRAAFPGSFDPPTYGHLNIIERAKDIFEEVLVIVAVNRDKKYLFTPEERLDFMEQLVAPWANVKVKLCDTLVVEYAKNNGYQVLIRGVRGLSDFAYEFDLSLMNKSLDPEVETIFMTTDPRYFVLRSSSIKELASFGGDVTAMVPPLIAKALQEKYSPAST